LQKRLKTVAIAYEMNVCEDLLKEKEIFGQSELILALQALLSRLQEEQSYSQASERQSLLGSYLQLAIKYVYTIWYHLGQGQNIDDLNFSEVLTGVWDQFNGRDIIPKSFESLPALEQFIQYSMRLIYSVGVDSKDIEGGLGISIKKGIRDVFAKFFFDNFLAGLNYQDLYSQVQLDSPRQFKQLLQSYCGDLIATSGRQIFLDGLKGYFLAPKEYSTNAPNVAGLPDSYQILAQKEVRGEFCKVRIQVGNQRLPSESAAKVHILNVIRELVDELEDGGEATILRVILADGAVSTPELRNKVVSWDYDELLDSEQLSAQFKNLLALIKILIFDHHPTGKEKLWQPAGCWSTLMYCKAWLDFIYSKPESEQKGLLKIYRRFMFLTVLESPNATDLDMLATPIALELMVTKPRWFYDNMSILSEIFFVVHAMDNCSGAVPTGISTKMAEMYLSLRGLVFSEAGQQDAYISLYKMSPQDAAQVVLELTSEGTESLVAFVEFVKEVFNSGEDLGCEISCIPDQSKWTSRDLFEGKANPYIPPQDPQVIQEQFVSDPNSFILAGNFDLLPSPSQDLRSDQTPQTPRNQLEDTQTLSSPSWLKIFFEFGPSLIGYKEGNIEGARNYTEFYKYAADFLKQHRANNTASENIGSNDIDFLLGLSLIGFTLKGEQEQVDIKLQKTFPEIRTSEPYLTAQDDLLEYSNASGYDIFTPQDEVKVVLYKGKNHQMLPTACVINKVGVLVIDRPSDHPEHKYGQSVICYGYSNGEMEAARHYKSLVSMMDSYLKKKEDGVESSFGGGDVTSGTKLRGLDHNIELLSPHIGRLYSDFSYLYYSFRNHKMSQAQVSHCDQLMDKYKYYQNKLQELSSLDFESALVSFVMDLDNLEAVELQNILIGVTPAKS
jgi:hypothetical protein